jgi:hypothetical protein
MRNKKTGPPTYVPIVSAIKTRRFFDLELEYDPPLTKNAKPKAAPAKKKKTPKRRKA